MRLHLVDQRSSPHLAVHRAQELGLGNEGVHHAKAEAVGCLDAADQFVIAGNGQWLVTCGAAAEKFSVGEPEQGAKHRGVQGTDRAAAVLPF